MVPTNGRKCIRFIVDPNREKFFAGVLLDFLKTFGNIVMFHRPIRDEDGVFVTFLFADGNDDPLIDLLWDIVIYFGNGNYLGVEKVSFLMNGGEIKLYPKDTAVS